MLKKMAGDTLNNVMTQTEQNMEKKILTQLKLTTSNWMFTNNHENAFKIESGCRRLCAEKRPLFDSVYAEIADANSLQQLFTFFHSATGDLQSGIGKVR